MTDLTIVNEGLRNRIAELEAANAALAEGIEVSIALTDLPPWHLRDNHNKVWRIEQPLIDGGQGWGNIDHPYVTARGAMFHVHAGEEPPVPCSPLYRLVPVEEDTE